MAHREMKLPELCDVCGQPVPPEEAVRAELTASGAMCPSPMTFHPPCYERASVMWQPDPDDYCTVDPLYPETAQWSTASAETRAAANSPSVEAVDDTAQEASRA